MLKIQNPCKLIDVSISLISLAILTIRSWRHGTNRIVKACDPYVAAICQHKGRVWHLDYGNHRETSSGAAGGPYGIPTTPGDSPVPFISFHSKARLAMVHRGRRHAQRSVNFGTEICSSQEVRSLDTDVKSIMLELVEAVPSTAALASLKSANLGRYTTPS